MVVKIICSIFAFVIVPKMDSLIRENIIKVAESLFVKYGIKSIKVDDICNELRMSKKTFYAEFENKEALIDEVYGLMHSKSPEKFDKLSGVENCDNIIDLWMRRPSMAMREHHKKYEVFMYDLLKYYPQIHQKRLEQSKSEISTVFMTVLEKGIEQGYFRSDMNKPMMVSFMLDWNRIAVDNLLQLPKAEHRKYVQFLLDAWIRMVCSEEGLAYYKAHYENGEKK